MCLCSDNEEAGWSKLAIWPNQPTLIKKLPLTHANTYTHTHIDTHCCSELWPLRHIIYTVVHSWTLDFPHTSLLCNLMGEFGLSLFHSTSLVCFSLLFSWPPLFFIFIFILVCLFHPPSVSVLCIYFFISFFNTLKTLTCQRLTQWWENEWMTIASRKLSKMVYYESIDGTFSVMLSDQIWIWLTHDNSLYLTLMRCISRMLSTFFFLKKILSFVECSPVSPFCSFLPLSLFSLFLPLAYSSPWPFQLLIIHWMLSTMTCRSLILPSAFTDTYIQGCDKRT